MKLLNVSRTALVAGVLLAAAAAPRAEITQYKLTAKADPHADFSKLKTYEWELGWIAIDRDAHRHFVEAINRELAALGFTEGEPGKSDVAVAYYSLRRTDTDLSWKPPTLETPPPTYPVGTLIVVMREPGTRRELFTARADAPIDLEPARLNAIIDDTVGRMFALYPTRRSAQPSSRR